MRKTVKVKTKYGLLEGLKKEGFDVFRGVPYARPPIGKLRFKAPVECEPWEGIREAFEFGNICPQVLITEGYYYKEFYADPTFIPPQSEDCLYLNIWAPEDSTPDSKYPVAMWIHGGSFDHGWGSEEEFDGAAFARRGVILVTINYRVGPFGFLALSELRNEDPNGSTGNYGLLDQIMALRWIRENISAFGGDPERITVFGQSRGSISTQSLVSSPLTEGMISRAILQSGTGLPGIGFSLENAYSTGCKVKELVGRKDLEELRKVPAEKLVEITEELYRLGGSYRPVTDGYVLKKLLKECADDGDIRDIPYMLGMTKDDIDVTGGEYVGSMFYNGMMDFAEARKANSDKPVYLYLFRHDLPGDDMGAIHSWELWYVFNTLDRCWRPLTEKDRRLSEYMCDIWTDFIKGKDISDRWTVYSGADSINYLD